METWATVALVLGSNIIVALSTFFITKMQVRSSDRRFEKELEQTREENRLKRRWEVRSKPLLGLRDELSVAVTKLTKLAKRGNAFTPSRTSEQTAEALRQAENDWLIYVSEDHLERALNSLSDKEIVDRIKRIVLDYLDIHSVTTDPSFREKSAREFGEAARAAEETLRPKVAEIQELINKRLEEL